MPKSLLDRLPEENSVAGFRRAARARFTEGEALAAAGHRTGAIYLWGYAAEMTLKAAYFGNLLGRMPEDDLTMDDLRRARAAAPGFGLTWVGNLHNLGSWAALVVRFRAVTPGRGYADAALADAVIAAGARLGRLWSEQIRYHGNVAYSHEVAACRRAVEWLMGNARVL